MVPFLQVEGLTRYWGDNILFESLYFTIAQGQKVALIARNGAGKTTLLDTIMGKDLPDSGKVTFSNEISVAYLSQVPVLNPDFTVMQEVYHSSSGVSNSFHFFRKEINTAKADRISKTTKSQGASNNDNMNKSAVKNKKNRISPDIPSL